MDEEVLTSNYKPETIFLDDAEIILDANKAAFLPRISTLCFTDLHFGFGDDVKEGVSLRLLKHLVKNYNPERIVALGDYLADDLILSEGYESSLREILDILSGCETIFIRGNTDTKQKFLGFELVDEFRINGLTFAHGHQSQFLNRIEDGEKLILGHGHPTVFITGNHVPCFLHYKNTLLLPAFSPYQHLGNDILRYVKSINFPSNYFYAFNWNVFAVMNGNIVKLGRRDDFGTVTKWDKDELHLLETY